VCPSLSWRLQINRTFDILVLGKTDKTRKKVERRPAKFSKAGTRRVPPGTPPGPAGFERRRKVNERRRSELCGYPFSSEPSQPSQPSPAGLPLGSVVRLDFITSTTT